MLLFFFFTFTKNEGGGFELVIFILFKYSISRLSYLFETFFFNCIVECFFFFFFDMTVKSTSKNPIVIFTTIIWIVPYIFKFIFLNLR
jgi:hypothetical protein